ncbi:hypothetical protein N566_22215 [Streptomycetaceae bacterium MP113-05]|nr:hypothetical protein N566_22215 [Streptomycetaceae bacterium MP113-05]
MRHALRGVVGDAVPRRVVVESPPRRGSGDYATGAVLQAARAGGVDSRVLAQRLAESLAGRFGVGRVEVTDPGFLSVTLDGAGRSALIEALTGQDRSVPDAPAQDARHWAQVTGERYEKLLRRTEASPLFRVQYAHARTRALLRNAADLGFTAEAGAGAHPYEGPAERGLLALLADQHRIAEARDHARLARHLTTVADAWHGFHETCPPLPRGDEKPGAAHRARLALTEACGTVLAGGLSQLGVTAPAHL